MYMIFKINYINLAVSLNPKSPKYKKIPQYIFINMYMHTYVCVQYIHSHICVDRAIQSKMDLIYLFLCKYMTKYTIAGHINLLLFFSFLFFYFTIYEFSFTL